MSDIFITATEHGDEATVQKLLKELKASVNLKSTRGGFTTCALSVAATYGQAHILAELLEVCTGHQQALFTYCTTSTFYTLYINKHSLHTGCQHALFTIHTGHQHALCCGLRIKKI